MPAITDPNRLAELQDKRQELHAKMKAFHTENEAQWNDEHEATWVTMNAEYDGVNSELEDHQRCLQAEQTRQDAANARNERLSRMEDGMRRFDASTTNRLKFGGKFDVTAGRFMDGPLKGLTQDDVSNLAMTSWFIKQGGELELTDQHVAACRQVGLNPAAKHLNFQLFDTKRFGSLRNEYVNAMALTRSPEMAVQNVRNALGTSSGVDGGYTFGETFITDLEVAMIAASGMMEASDIIRTATGEPMRWPTVNDTSNKGRQIGENRAVSESSIAFGQTMWYAFKFTSDELLVPSELLRDNAVNLIQLIPDLLGLRLGRIVNEKATTGNGAGTVRGILPQVPVGVTAASGTAIAFDETIDLEHSVNRIHRSGQGVRYMFSDAVLLLLRKLKNGSGDYLWQSGANAGAPDTLNKTRYTINDDMPTPASGVRSMLYGNLRQYKMRMIRAVRMYRLTERHRENDQDAFLAFIEFDANLLDAGDNPVKCLVHP